MLSIYCNMVRPEEKAIIHEIETLKIPCAVRLMRHGLQRDPADVVAILRTMSHDESRLIATYLECAQVRSINSSHTIGLCTDKAALATMADSHGVPQPDFRIVFSPAELREVVERMNFSAVIKPISSSWGRGVCRVCNPECLESWFAARESLDANHRAFPVMVQNYIEKPGYDVRVVVVGTEPVVAFRRYSDHWKTNTHTGAKVVPTDITAAMRTVVAKIVTMLDRGIYGVDLFETADGAILLNEVNHNPEFAKSSHVHGVNVAQRIAAYAQECLWTM